MLFMALLRDKPGHLSVRVDTRPAHLDWIKAVGVVRLAGPLLSDDGEQMIGSLLVVEAQTLADAKALLASDPYAIAGLFDSMDIHPWRWVIGAPTV